MYVGRVDRAGLSFALGYFAPSSGTRSDRTPASVTPDGRNVVSITDSRYGGNFSLVNSSLRFLSLYSNATRVCRTRDQGLLGNLIVRP